MKTYLKDYKRRDFLKSSVLMGTFFAVSPYSFAIGERMDKLKYGAVIKERIVPVSINWDVANLMMKDVNISWKMMDSISEQFNKMVAGSVIDKGLDHVPEMLDIIQHGGAWDEETHRKAALFAGWVVHRQTADVFREMYKNDTDPLMVALRDAVVLKYKIARGTDVSPSQAAMEDLFKSLYHRATFRTHTLTPDTNDWERWVIDYLDWYAEDRRNMEELAKSWVQGLGGNAFLEEDDVLLKLCNNYAIWEINLTEDFIKERVGKSYYAQAVARALIGVKTLDEYFKGNVSKEALIKKLNLSN